MADDIVNQFRALGNHLSSQWLDRIHRLFNDHNKEIHGE